MATAFAAVKTLASKGIDEWTIVVAAIYLFAKGFENLGKGINEIQEKQLALRFKRP